MGSCCGSAKVQNPAPNIPDSENEEINFEKDILLQEIDKISELIRPVVDKTLNSYLETVLILLDCINSRIFQQKLSLVLSQIRGLRLLMQRLREAFHDLRVQDSIDIQADHRERSQNMINQLEFALKSYLEGPVVRGFFDSDEKSMGFDQIFDKLSKIHKEIRDTYQPETFKKFSSNTSAQFWLLAFQNPRVGVRWKEFSEAFQKFTTKAYDIVLSPEALLVIQSEIDINNDLQIELESWDYFYREIWSNSSKRIAVLNTAADFKDFYLNMPQSQLELRFFRTTSENKEQYFPNDTTFYIQEKKIQYSTNLNLQPRLKDFFTGFVLAGKHPRAEISFDKLLKEVSTKHFQIHLKNAVIPQHLFEPSFSESGQLIRPRIETWFILNNMAKRNMLSFLVDEKGFALTKGMIVNVNGNFFKINDVNPSPNLYADDDLNYVDSRPKGLNPPPFRNSQECFIDLEFFKNGPKDIKKYQFTAPKKEDCFQISIGSNKKKKNRSDIYIEDDKEDYVSRKHCFILYNPKKSCWVIKDETYNEKDLPFYKTYVLTCGIEEYDLLHKTDKDVDYVARGQKLVEGMKFTFANNMFEVKSIREVSDL